MHENIVMPWLCMSTMFYSKLKRRDFDRLLLSFSKLISIGSKGMRCSAFILSLFGAIFEFFAIRRGIAF